MTYTHDRSGQWFNSKRIIGLKPASTLKWRLSQLICNHKVFKVITICHKIAFLFFLTNAILPRNRIICMNIIIRSYLIISIGLKCDNRPRLWSLRNSPVIPSSKGEAKSNLLTHLKLYSQIGQFVCEDWTFFSYCFAFTQLLREVPYHYKYFQTRPCPTACTVLDI